MENITETNPFSLGYLVKFDEGDEALFRFKIDYSESDDDELHVITNYDTLVDLAFDRYGDSKYWWILADVNNIENPFILEPNTNLIIPNLNRLKATVLS